MTNIYEWNVGINTTGRDRNLSNIVVNIPLWIFLHFHDLSMKFQMCSRMVSIIVSCRAWCVFSQSRCGDRRLDRRRGKEKRKKNYYRSSLPSVWVWYVLISSLNCEAVSLVDLQLREVDWSRRPILALAFTPERYPLIETGRAAVNWTRSNRYFTLLLVISPCQFPQRNLFFRS